MTTDPAELIDASRMTAIQAMLERWLALLDRIHRIVREQSAELESKKDSADPKHIVLAHLSLAQFMTFSSILSLLRSALYADAFTLLRPLYEGHLLLWGISRGDQANAEVLLHLSTVHDWKVARDVLGIQRTGSISEFYTDQRIEELEKRYKEATIYLGANSGALPVKPTKKLARLIDSYESEGRPFRQLMHVRLYTSGSEYIHRSMYGIKEGFAIIENPATQDPKWVMAPNPSRGVESAWWSSILLLDGFKWQAESLGQDFPIFLADLRKDVLGLAAEWLSPGS